jgi:hypothetical protein
MVRLIIAFSGVIAGLTMMCVAWDRPPPSGSALYLFGLLVVCLSALSLAL